LLANLVDVGAGSNGICWVLAFY